MKRPLYKFLVLSLGAHLVFSLFTIFIAVMPEGVAAPIKVSLAEPLTVKNDNLKVGRIEDLKEPDKFEEPDKADILSRSSSRAHSPEKGKKHQAKKTAIPHEKVNPPDPARKKSKEDSPAKSPDPVKTRIASLEKPKQVQREKAKSGAIDVFSKDISKKVFETEKTARSEKDKIEREKTSRTLSAKLTDQPEPDINRPVKPSGMTGASGSELDTYATSDTRDVIDMGDEAVVSLNTKSFKYVDYFETVKKAVENVWMYPEVAIIKGWSGRVMLRFTVNRDGELEGAKLVKSSGHSSLDAEAKKAIKAAGPFDPFPPTLDKKRIHIVATFIYQPTFSAIR